LINSDSDWEWKSSGIISEDIIKEHFPKHFYNRILLYIDDVKYVTNSHLIIVKSPVTGICIVEPTLRESYHILKTIDISSMRLD
jgi:hypothetical protein